MTQQEIKEGLYLAAGVKKVPIPFTQDPTLKGDKGDMQEDSTILKGGELRKHADVDGDDDSVEVDGVKGKKNPKGSNGKKFGGSMTGNGDSMAESYNEFKLGDTVCLNNIKNREWIIESIQINESENTAKFHLKNGLRKMIVNPSEMIVEHIEGVEIHQERFQDSVSDLRKIYEEMEMNSQLEGTQGAGGEPVADPELMPKCESTLMEKKDLYHHIKNHGLHECGDNGMALQKLSEMCGNPMEEIQSVYEHACMSHNDPGIDDMYGYSECEFNDNNAGLMNNLSSAYEEMMKRETMEETAKKTAEEADRGNGGVNGGLGPNSITLNEGLRPSANFGF